MENELRRILALHSELYPEMTEQDLVKLIFQGEFGGGHLLTDFDRCKAWIEQEYRQIPQKPNLPLYEDIGFGFVRIQLAALDASGFTPLDVAEQFFASASVPYGREETYRTKLALLPHLVDDRFIFTGEQLAVYIESYLTTGGGMLSHTATYRQLYTPAYRVIRLADKKR